MVLKSIGYKSVPVDGLPFDHQKGKTKGWMHQVGLLILLYSRCLQFVFALGKLRKLLRIYMNSQICEMQKQKEK